MYLLLALIGSLDCLQLLWLVRIITLVLVLRHSNENRCIIKFKLKVKLSLASYALELKPITIDTESGRKSNEAFRIGFWFYWLTWSRKWCEIVFLNQLWSVVMHLFLSQIHIYISGKLKIMSKNKCLVLQMARKELATWNNWVAIFSSLEPCVLENSLKLWLRFILSSKIHLIFSS